MVFDELKFDVRETVIVLRERGIESIMVIGDNLKIVCVIVCVCGIEIIYVEVLLMDKVNIIKEL